MSEKVMVFRVNVIKQNMPVREWLSKDIELHKKIGGLLDYGYDRSQITNMLGIPNKELRSLMRHYGYKTIDKFKVRYKTI